MYIVFIMYCICIDKKTPPLIVHRNEKPPQTNHSTPTNKRFTPHQPTPLNPLSFHFQYANEFPMTHLRTTVESPSNQQRVIIALLSRYYRVIVEKSTNDYYTIPEPLPNLLHAKQPPPSHQRTAIKPLLYPCSPTILLPTQTFQAPRSAPLPSFYRRLLVYVPKK